MSYLEKFQISLEISYGIFVRKLAILEYSPRPCFVLAS